MFRKRIKKEFPPGTFIPTPARVAAIVQLCLAFSLLLWQASQPFMGDLFHIKSQMLIYQDVMGIDTHKDSSLEKTARLERNAERFASLPRSLKHGIMENYATLQEQLGHSFRQKMHRLGHIFAYEISSYELLWMILSIVIPILLLKRIEGARHAVWLLPALALFFLFDNQRQGHLVVEQEKQLFPSEKEIVQNYLKEPLSSDILQQREQLLKGWNFYLIINWAQEKPSEDPVIFQKQAEHGEFMFNIGRLTMMEKMQKQFPQKTSLFILCMYLAWNLFFAWHTTHHLQMEKKQFGMT